MSFKLPVSVLVVIYAEDTKRVLMLQRRDDPAFWQSVTGSLEAGETAAQAAVREVKEEVAIDVYTAWEEMGAVRDALEAAGLKADAAEVSMIPSTKADMDAETAPKLLRLIDMLEDCDDGQEVYHNGEISDEVAATL